MNLRNRGFEKAARIYGDHIRAVPPDAPSLYKAYTALVKVQLLARDTVEAQSKFNDFTRDFANNGPALRYFGAEIYPYQDRFTTKGRIQVLEMAEKVFRLALPLTHDPVEKTQCQFDLGAVLNYLNKSQEAVTLLEESVAGTADEIIKEERSLRLADAYRRSLRLDEAQALYMKLSTSERTGIRESAKTGLVYVESDRKAKKKD
jgi:tetratricopeptide (TPR) repeat protein